MHTCGYRGSCAWSLQVQIVAKSLLEAESLALKKLGEVLFGVCFGHIGSMSEEWNKSDRYFDVKIMLKMILSNLMENIE